MYKALLSFTTIKSYGDVKKGEILDSDFDTPEAIQEYLDIGYIEEYHGGGGSNFQSKSVEITENGTQNVRADSGYDALDEVNITTNVSGGDIDWTAIGYSGMPQNITDGYNHAIDILNSWDSTTNTFGSRFSSDRQLIIMPLLDIPNIINLTGAFYGCHSLVSLPLFNTENITNMSECFRECRALMSVPKFNTSKVTKMQRMFANCYSLATVPLLDTSAVTGNNSFNEMFINCSVLTDTSLDNILQMCINAVNYTGTKTLRTLGIMSATIYPTSRIEALPHYQDFIDAGWTIGY